MDWIAGNSLYKPSPFTKQQQQSTMHAVKQRLVFPPFSKARPNKLYIFRQYILNISTDVSHWYGYIGTFFHL
jgi:hypothetical protein